VHYLLFGEERANEPKVAKFNQLLAAGTDADAAIKEAFGDLAPYYGATRAYLGRKLLSYNRLPITADAPPEGFAARPLAPAEAAVVRGQFLVAMQRPVEARAAAAEARQADQSLPGPWEIEAALLEIEQKREEAREAYAKAVAAGSRRAHVYYRLAQLDWGRDLDAAKLARLAELLEKARELEPENASALSFLADVRTQMGQPALAIPLARKAVQLEPSSSYHRLAFARALARLGQPEDALKVADAALRAADDDASRRNAQQLIDYIHQLQAQRAVLPAQPAPSSTPAPAAGPVTSGRGARDAARPAESHGAIEVDESSSALGRCLNDRDDGACSAAVPALSAACTNGRGESCRALGSLYDGGWGVPVDKTHAAALYTTGCTAGDRSSCARYALLQAQGTGVPRDPSAAVGTLQRLCASDVDDACIGWAVVLSHSKAAAELAKARELLKRSCANGNPEGCRLERSLLH
jgi:TPR repeat protein